MSLRTFGKHTIVWVVCLALVALCAFPFAGYAAISSQSSSSAPATDSTSNQRTTVKIGWYYSENFQEGLSDAEEKTGYCYEYIQKVADYNGWDFEYVYGDWASLFPKLQSGEIDVMAGVSDTTEREAYLSFPSYAMGTERYYLYQHGSTPSMDASDVSTFEAKKIGAITNNLMTTYLEQWLSANNAHPEIVYYSSFDERDADFEAGILDGVVATDNNVPAESGYASVVKVGEEPYYLAVTKGRTDLLQQLNYSLNIIQQMDPYFVSDLSNRHFGATVTNSTLTAAEESWLEAHSTLRVGYLDNYLPYCATDAKGQATGLMTDVLNAILSKLKIQNRLTVQYQAYASNAELTQALTAGEIDVAFPFSNNLWALDQAGLNASSTVVECSMDLVYKGTFDESKTDTIAINVNNGLQRTFVEKYYPEAQLVECDSIDACIKAVDDGAAGCTVLNGLRTSLVSNDSTYDDFSLLQLSNTDTRCFALARGNSGLLLLVNRGLQVIGDTYGLSASYQYADQLYSFNAADFLRAHVLSLSLLALLVVALIILTLVRHLRTTRRAAQAAEEHLEEITQLNDSLEEARTAAEAASQAKSNFLFNMSHDIRTPMNAIIGYADLLEKHGDDPEKRADYLQKLRASGDFLLSLINNVLEMSRIESGKTMLNETCVRAGDIAGEVRQVYSDLMEKKGITFTYASEVTTEYVYADQVKLREIYLNLISNAYKYTPEGGSVSMHVKEVPSERAGYANMIATVADTGIGMSADFLPHIFERFSRERNSTESKIQGTGLGMPIVKRLVELMGGTIEVESQVGQGTTFTFTCWYRIGSAGEMPQELKVAATERSFAGKRILLTEDNDLNAEIATEILNEEGFLVERAEDGQKAVDMLTAHDTGYYDVILMDIQMPHMNGYEATHAIRALDSERAQIPILAMTANAFEEDKQAALAAGMDGHIAKPIDVAALLQALSSVL